MRMSLDRIERYARGKSPLVGIPVWDSTVDKLVTAVFLRSLLEAAVEFAKDKGPKYGGYVEYVSKADNVRGTRTHELVFNGLKAGSWRLIDLKQAGKMAPWQIRERLESWARGRRTAAITRAKTEELGKDGVYVHRLREAILKLEKQRDKIRPSRPSNPVLEKGWPRGDKHIDKMEWEWREQKPMRKALAKVQAQRIKDTLYGFLTTGGKWGYKKRVTRKAGYKMDTWAAFYQCVEIVIGREVGEGYRHDRVCTRRNGPDRIDYLKELPKYIHLAGKPYRGCEWHGEDRIEKRIEQYREARKEYLDDVREVKALQGQIDAHLAEIQSALENKVN